MAMLFNQSRRYINWLLAIIVGFSITGTIYIHFIQTPIMARRELAFALVLLIVSTLVSYQFFVHIFFPKFHSLSPDSTLILCISSLVLSLFLLTIPGIAPVIIRLLPIHTLDIKTFPNSSTIIQSFSTQYGDISYYQFTQTGSWERIDNTLRYQGGNSAALSWEGRVGDQATLVFLANPDGGTITTSWDGSLETIDLKSASPAEIPFTHGFPVPFTLKLLSYLFIWICGAILFSFVLIVNFHFSTCKTRKPIGLKWLFFTLPMITIWILAILTFWPGIMSTDSVNQWNQVITGQFTDAHPAFHTILMWLLSRIWLTPALLIVAQIIGLSLVISWGLGQLYDLGVHRSILWLMAVIFTISPVNISMVITLWKDIPYSIMVFLLSLIMLRICSSRGEWLQMKTSWFWLGVVCAAISLFRHNGFPIGFFCLILLTIFYQEYWKQIFIGLVTFLAIWVFFLGPVYQIFNVKKITETKQVVFLHHIAAHINAGTPLSSEEITYLNRIQPVAEWNYDCERWTATESHYVSPKRPFIFSAVNLDNKKPAEIAWNLFLRDPLVDFRHLACSSALVWNTDVSKNLLTNMLGTDQNQWIISNQKETTIRLGLIEDSQIPSLLPFFHHYLRTTSSMKSFLFVWSPALYLYLGLFFILGASIWHRNIKLFLYFFPALIQSAVMILVNIAPQFRYQYSVYLIGLFSLCLLFKPKSWISKNP